jgi:hypothetical protein
MRKSQPLILSCVRRHQPGWAATQYRYRLRHAVSLYLSLYGVPCMPLGPAVATVMEEKHDGDLAVLHHV